MQAWLPSQNVLSLFSSSSLSEGRSGEVALGSFSAGEMSFLLLIGYASILGADLDEFGVFFGF